MKTVESRDFWVRRWRGEFTSLGGETFSQLCIFESTLPGTFDMEVPQAAYQDMARVTRKLERTESANTLYLCIDRTMTGVEDTTPVEQWMLTNADATRVEYLTMSEVLALLQQASFDACSKCPLKAFCPSTAKGTFCGIPTN